MMNNLTKLQVGVKYDSFMTNENDVLAEWDNEEGLILIYRINGIRDNERTSVLEKKPFSFRFCIIESVCFFTLNIDGGYWDDTPFSPVAIKSKIKLPSPLSKSEGLPLTVMVFDTETGELKVIRRIGLGNDFSNKWLKWFCNEETIKLPLDSYISTVENTFNEYSSDELARLAQEQGNVYEIE